jgi:hypothetical protein
MNMFSCEDGEEKPSDNTIMVLYCHSGYICGSLLPLYFRWCLVTILKMLEWFYLTTHKISSALEPY